MIGEEKSLRRGRGGKGLLVSLREPVNARGKREESMEEKGRNSLTCRS